MVNWAEQFDAATALLICAHDTVHDALVVYAMAQAKLVAYLVTHDMASVHQKVLFSVRVINTVPCRVIATE